MTDAPRPPCRHLTQSAEGYRVSLDGHQQRVRVLLCDWPISQPVETWPTWMQKRCGGGDALHDGTPECDGCPAYRPRTIEDA